MPNPRLSVVIRTQGLRPDLLEEALLSLAAQTADSLEVLLAVHSGDPAAVDEVSALVSRFPQSFRDRVEVFGVPDGGRARPLNAAMDRANGELLAFLDDDDVVTAHWAEVFLASAEEAPGTVIRSVTADQPVRRLRGGRSPRFEPTGPVTVPEHRTRFDLIEHLDQNRTPICALALPLDEVREAGLRFDESLSVMEDWHFLVHAAVRFGVQDTGIVTAIYRRWDDHEATWYSIDREDWAAARQQIWASFDELSFTLPPGSRARLVQGPVAAQAPPPSRADSKLRDEVRALKADLQRVRKERDRATSRVEAIEASTSWRLTAPIRKLLDVLRGRR